MRNAFLAVLFIAAISICSCEKKNDEDSAAPSSLSQRIVVDATPSSIGDPIDYVPTKPGTVLAYKIKTGPAEPLQFNQVIWPEGDRASITSTRGRFFAVVLDSTNEVKKTYFLTLRVKCLAEKQGGLSLPIGVELAVDKDDLGIYRDYKQVFLAANPRNRFMCREVVVYPPEKSMRSGPWGSWGGEDGYSVRLVFFGDKPGIQIGFGEKPKDELLFEGIKSVPGLNARGLHFLRTVKPAERKDGDKGSGYLDKGFEEDTYFVRGKGLVYLEQRVDGEISMTWTRVDLTEL